MEFPKLIGLHGFWGCASDFSFFTDSLRALGMDSPILFPSLPGHGREPLLACENSIEKLAFWFLSQVCGEESATDLTDASLPERGEMRSAMQKPVLLGYSLGGRIALAAALQSPDSFGALILLSSSAGLPSCREREARARADALLAAELDSLGTEAELEAFLEAWWRQPVFASPRWESSFYRRFFPTRLAADPRKLARVLREASVGLQPSFWDSLPLLRCPCLFIAGDADQKFCSLAKKMASLTPLGEFQILEGSGHSLLLENPPMLAGVVDDFLRRLGRNRSLAIRDRLPTNLPK